MRDRIVTTAIISFDEDICNEIYKSLCYSTHVNLIIIKNKDQQFLYTYRCKVIDINEGSDYEIIANYKRLIEENNLELLYIASSIINKEIILLANHLDINIANGSSFKCYEKDSQHNLINDITHKFLIEYLNETNNLRLELEEIISIVTKDVTKYSQLGTVDAKKIVFDCFRDRHGNTILVTPIFYFSDSLERIFYNGIDDAIDSIIHFVNKLGDRFGFRGPWSFDINFDQDAIGYDYLKEIKFLPAHTGWIFHRAKGINIPLLCVQDFLDRDIQIMPLIDSNKLMWSAEMELFIDIEYSVIFIDLDETVIIENEKVPIVLDLLKKAKSDSKIIILLTRHKKNIISTLEKSFIDVGIFNKVIHVLESEKKSDKIKLESENINGKMIFIDNEFPERRDVSNNCNIPVFDVNGIDFILQ